MTSVHKLYSATAYGYAEVISNNGCRVTATASGTATSTISYDDALIKAQIVANSTAKSQAEQDSIGTQCNNYTKKNAGYFEQYSIIKNNSYNTAGYSTDILLTNPKSKRGGPPSPVGELWIKYKIDFKMEGYISISITNINAIPIEVTRIGNDMDADLPPNTNYVYTTTNKVTNNKPFYMLNNNVLSFVTNPKLSKSPSWDITYKTNTITTCTNIGISNKNTSFLGMCFVLNYNNNQMIISNDRVENTEKTKLVLPTKYYNTSIIPDWIYFRINSASIIVKFTDDESDQIQKHTKNITNITKNIIPKNTIQKTKSCGCK
jgi:hypothetical protein